MKHKTLDQLLDHCAAQGFVFIAYYDDPREADYRGTDKALAKEALEACDEMKLAVRTADNVRVGTFLIVNEFEGDPEEQIADYTINLEFSDLMEEEEA